MRTKTIFFTSFKTVHFKYLFEVSWGKKIGESHPNVLSVFFFFFFFLNFKLLLLKFIYHNSMYIALNSVLNGGKSGEQVVKY